MIPIIVDTREQKTPALVHQYKIDHPKITQELVFVNKCLNTGDFMGNQQLVEIKWGQDLVSSINSDRLENEFIKMKQFQLDHPATILHLMMCDDKKYQIDMKMLKRVVSLAQRYSIWVHHRESMSKGMDALIDIIHNPPPPIDLGIPVQRSKKDPFLIDVLSRIPYVSPQLAESIIPTSWQTIKDLFRFNEAEYQHAINEFYDRDMRAICQNIVKKLGL